MSYVPYFGYSFSYFYQCPFSVIICKSSFRSGSKFRGIVTQDTRGPKMGDIRQWTGFSMALVVLLGLTWAFGLLYMDSQDTILFAYLFTVCNSLQGFFIFLFHVLCNDKVQKEYRRWARRTPWVPLFLRGPHAEYTLAPVHNYGKGRGSLIPSSPLDHSTESTSGGSQDVSLHPTFYSFILCLFGLLFVYCVFR